MFLQSVRAAVGYIFSLPGVVTTALGPGFNLIVAVWLLYLLSIRAQKFSSRISYCQISLLLFFIWSVITQLFSSFAYIDSDFTIIGLYSDLILFVITMIAMNGINDFTRVYKYVSLGFIIGTFFTLCYLLTISDVRNINLLVLERLGIGENRVFSHGNAFAFSAGTSIILLISLQCYIKKRLVKMISFAVILFFAACILMTISKSTILALSGAIFVALLVKGFYAVCIAALIISVPILFFDLSFLIDPLALYLETQGLTLSNRTFIWESALNDSFATVKSFLCGYGYNGFREAYRNFNDDGNMLYSAHNDFLNNLWSTGFVGTILLYIPFVYMLFWGIKNILIKKRYKHYSLEKNGNVLYGIFLLNIYYLIRGAGEANIGLTSNVFWLYLINFNLFFSIKRNQAGLMKKNLPHEISKLKIQIS